MLGRAVGSCSCIVALSGAGCGRIGYDAVTDAGAETDAAVDAAVDAGPDPLLAGCVLYQHMDEPSWSGLSGEVGDACGDDDRGTATAGATTVASGVRGRAGEFSGGSSCVRIADRAGLHAGAALTISAWVFPTALDGSREFGIVSKRVDYGVAGEYSVFLWSGDHVYVDVDTENDRLNGSAVLVNDAWQQVTVVYDGAVASDQRIRTYVDGALDVIATETSATATAFATDLYVGCLPLGMPAQAFVGKLDEIVIWTRALSPAEVGAWYQQTRP